MIFVSRYIVNYYILPLFLNTTLSSLKLCSIGKFIHDKMSMHRQAPAVLMVCQIKKLPQHHSVLSSMSLHYLFFFTSSPINGSIYYFSDINHTHNLLLIDFEYIPVFSLHFYLQYSHNILCTKNVYSQIFLAQKPDDIYNSTLYVINYYYPNG